MCGVKMMSDGLVHLPSKTDKDLILDIIRDYDVYLIEVQSISMKEEFRIIGSNIFCAKNGNEISQYIIATADLKTCRRIIFDLRFMLQENGMKVRRYDKNMSYIPLFLMVYPNASHALMRSIDYIETEDVVSTMHSDGYDKINKAEIISDDKMNSIPIGETKMIENR